MLRESAAVRVLLVSRDIQTIEFLCQHMQQLAMHVETSCDVGSAMRKLCHCKFEGVIIDFELADEACQLLTRLRELTSHGHAISFAIVDQEIETSTVFRAHANFVLRRPFSASSVVRILRASYPMMFRERRREYRYPIEVRIVIKTEHSEFAAGSINISETGILINSPTPLQIGARVHLRIDLPGMQEALSTYGEVCWTDASGRIGVHFLEPPARSAERLQLWLSERMSELVLGW